MGRHAHNYSSNKLPLLHSALDCFVTCLAVLSTVGPVHEGVLTGDDGYDFESDSRSAGYGNSGTDLLGPGFNPGVEVFPLSEFPEAARPLSCSLSPSPSPSTAAARSTSPTESIVTSITDLIDKTLDCPDADPFLSDYKDVADVELNGGNEENLIARKSPFESDNEPEYSLKPPPLHVRKPPKPLSPISLSLDLNDTTNAPSSAQAQAGTTPRPRLLPQPIPIKAMTHGSDVTVTSPGGPKYISKPDVHRTPRTPRALRASANPYPSTNPYNNSLTFLHTQITSTITSLHNLIHEVTSIQQARTASRRRSIQHSVSFWSFAPVKNEVGVSSGLSLETASSVLSSDSVSSSSSRRESIQERIVRLRSERWETVGLRNRERGWKGAEYYREFCGMVLDELYLG